MGLSFKYPHWCQFLGATQHYFWLTAFAWMACITISINVCVLYKYLILTHIKIDTVGGILLAGPFNHTRCDIMSSIFWYRGSLLRMQTHLLAYGFHQCSLFFRDPYSLRSHFQCSTVLWICLPYSANIQHCLLCWAEKGCKERLIQCEKISSWIATSWLELGIYLPFAMHFKAARYF